MLKKPFYFIAGILSLALASAVQYTPIFFIDFTKVPQNIQILVSMCFVMLFVTFMVALGEDFYD